MPTAGDLRERLRFERRAQPVSDGAGNFEAAWEAQCTVAAGVRPLTGGESVTAARLAGSQPVVITVRRSLATLAITSAWRAVNIRSGEVYALTSPPADLERRGQYLDMLATIGRGS